MTAFHYPVEANEDDASNFEHGEYGLKACRIRQRDPKTGKITTLFDDGTL